MADLRQLYEAVDVGRLIDSMVSGTWSQRAFPYTLRRLSNRTPGANDECTDGPGGPGTDFMVLGAVSS